MRRNLSKYSIEQAVGAGVIMISLVSLVIFNPFIGLIIGLAMYFKPVIKSFLDLQKVQYENRGKNNE